MNYKIPEMSQVKCNECKTPLLISYKCPACLLHQDKGWGRGDSETTANVLLSINNGNTKALIEDIGSWINSVSKNDVIVALLLELNKEKQ